MPDAAPQARLDRETCCAQASPPASTRRNVVMSPPHEQTRAGLPLKTRSQRRLRLHDRSGRGSRPNHWEIASSTPVTEPRSRIAPRTRSSARIRPSSPSVHASKRSLGDEQQGCLIFDGQDQIPNGGRDPSSSTPTATMRICWYRLPSRPRIPSSRTPAAVPAALRLACRSALTIRSSLPGRNGSPASGIF